MVIQISCSSSEENLGATWIGPADFMHVTKDKMEMTYAVDVVGQKMDIPSFRSPNSRSVTLILKITVSVPFFITS